MARGCSRTHGPVANLIAGALPMLILYPSHCGVNARREFGAGILPPDDPSADQPYEPSHEDRLWWAAESARLEVDRTAGHARRNRRRSERPAWIYARSDRFRALIDRARELETY